MFIALQLSIHNTVYKMKSVWFPHLLYS